MRIAQVGEREFPFDLAYDPREHSNFASNRRSSMSCESWETWNREMLPVPDHLTRPMSNLTEMLW